MRIDSRNAGREGGHMIKRAQEMMQLVQDGVRNTMRVVADLADLEAPLSGGRRQ